MLEQTSGLKCGSIWESNENKKSIIYTTCRILLTFWNIEKLKTPYI